MIKVVNAKFIFRFKNKMLSISFDNYFINLNEIYKYNNTRQKAKSGYYYCSERRTPSYRSDVIAYLTPILCPTLLLLKTYQTTI